MKKSVVFLVVFCFAASAAAQKKQGSSYAKQVAAFEAYAENARNAWHMPGMAVVIVKDNQVLFKKGFGATRAGGAPVDTKTLFACASTTKAMTAVCMGILVDEGKVHWNDPVIQYLPDFQLYDPYVTRELKIRDLFIHDSGVGNADFLWGSMQVPLDEVIRRMALVKPAYSLRSSFIYQNIFYAIAGKVIQKISGQPWMEFVKTHIFSPLGMSRTFSSINDVHDANQTGATMRVDGKDMLIEHSSADAIGPAGSVWSCVDDMGTWAMCMLDSSKYADGRLLTAETWKEMFKPQTIVPPNEFYPTMQLIHPNWTTYGLGWFQHDYKGKKINYHTGSLAGAIALHAQLPDEKLAIYIYGNYDHAEVRHALVYKAFDLFALGGSRDWSTDFLKLYTGIREKNEKDEKDFVSARVAGTRPSLPLADYAGHYSDPLYGDLEVTASVAGLKFEANHFVKADLPHWHYDTFYGPYEKPWYGKAVVTFEINAKGKIEAVNFDGMKFEKGEK